MSYVVTEDIEIYRGDDWGPMIVQVFDQAVDEGGNPLWDDSPANTEPTIGPPLDLTGATVLAQVRRSAKLDADLLGTFETAVLDQDDPDTKGCFSLELTAETTTGLLEITEAIYDVQVTNAAGKKRTYVRGKVTVDPDVSRETP